MHALDPAQVLASLATSENVRATLDSFEPPQAGYKALKAELAKVRAAGDQASETPQAGGSAHERKRRDAKPAPAAHNRKADTIGLLVANMERWRWLPRKLGTAYVMVNVPDYTLEVVDKGNIVWQTKIVVGKPGHTATPC